MARPGRKGGTLAPQIDYVIVDYGTPWLAQAARESLVKCEVEHTVTMIDAKTAGLSYAEAINQGVALGDAPIICALNADVECLDSQRPVLGIFQTNPDIAVVGPRQVDGHGFIRNGGIVGTNEAPEHRFWGSYLDEVRHKSDEWILDCVTVPGSVYYARRDVFEDHGGFLPTRHYYEETWFSYLVRHHGHRVVYTAATTWLHHYNASPVTDEWKQERFLESQAIFRAACAREGIVCD